MGYVLKHDDQKTKQTAMSLHDHWKLIDKVSSTRIFNERTCHRKCYKYINSYKKYIDYTPGAFISKNIKKKQKS